MSRTVIPKVLLRPALTRDGRSPYALSEREFAEWQRRSTLLRLRRELGLAQALQRAFDSGRQIVERPGDRRATVWAKTGPRVFIDACWHGYYVGRHVARRACGFGWPLRIEGGAS